MTDIILQPAQLSAAAVGNSATTFGLPATAMRFERTALQMAAAEASDEAATSDGPPAPVPFSMLARTGSVVYSWYWGAIVHDMAGFTARKETIVADYCHDRSEILGFADKQTAADAGLTLSGFLTPFTEDDRASEVVYKSKAGVPYEASIEFDYSSVEYLQQAATAVVNGQVITGPCYIVRQWTLVGVAVCPYGVDGGTSTNFSRDPDRVIESRPVKLFSKPVEGTTMPPQNGTPAPPAETQQTTQTPATQQSSTTDPQAEFKAGLKRFTTKFGAVNGVQWFTDGKSYEEALELHATALETRLAAMDTETAELQTKLANAPRGESTPVTSGEPAPKLGLASDSRFAQLGRIGRFAAGIKLPGK